MLAGPAVRLCSCLKHLGAGSPYAPPSADSEADACETWAGSASGSSASSRGGGRGGKTAGHRAPEAAHGAAVGGDVFAWAALNALQYRGLSGREGCPCSTWVLV